MKIAGWTGGCIIVINIMEALIKILISESFSPLKMTELPFQLAIVRRDSIISW